jgi:hypothetical protein
LKHPSFFRHLTASKGARKLHLIASRRRSVNAKNTSQKNSHKLAIDPVATLSFFAYLATIVYSVFSILGYAFLASYYGTFGVRASDVIGGVEHFFFRGIELLRIDHILSSYVFVAMIFSIISGLSIVRSIWILFSFIALALVFFVLCFWRATDIADDFSARDLYSDTTALRALICVERNGQSLLLGPEESEVRPPLRLILSITESRLIYFSEPSIRSENVRVEVFSLRMGDGDVVRHASAKGFDPALRVVTAGSSCQR